MKRFGLRRNTRPIKPDAAPPQRTDKVIEILDIVAPVKPRRPSRDPKLNLTARQGLFLRHYLECNNGAEAARKAGYAKGSADVTAAQLIRIPRIAGEIERRRAGLIEALDVSPERISRELAKIAFANMQDFMSVNDQGAPVTDFSKLTRDQAAALAEITVEEFTDGRSDRREVRRVKFKHHDKSNALMLLGRNLGMFTEKHQHEHKHTLVGTLLDEIDRDARGPRVIEGTVNPEGDV